MTTTAPKYSESIPAVTAPVKLPRLSETRRPIWQCVAAVAGAVAVLALVVGVVVL